MAKHFAWLCLLWIWCAATLLPAQTVVINEIMYHPPSTNLLEEWFEIYNPGTNAVDLSGWQVTKGVEFTFPTNTVIGVGGYLVVARVPGMIVGGWEPEGMSAFAQPRSLDELGPEPGRRLDRHGRACAGRDGTGAVRPPLAKLHFCRISFPRRVIRSR